ncbi:hypothetical protein LA080_006235 [Diaporthe eres]|nr:hypothetical protein LA080_006235 [Diaporthe eres]
MKTRALSARQANLKPTNFECIQSSPHGSMQDDPHKLFDFRPGLVLWQGCITAKHRDPDTTCSVQCIGASIGRAEIHPYTTAYADPFIGKCSHRLTAMTSSGPEVSDHATGQITLSRTRRFLCFFNKPACLAGILDPARVGS